jgi:hypothetical protein
VIGIDPNLLKTISYLNEIARRNTGLSKVTQLKIPHVDAPALQGLAAWVRQYPLALDHIELPEMIEARELIHHTNDLTAAYAGFSDAVSSVSPNFPSSLVAQSAIEVFQHARTIEVLFPAQRQDTVDEAGVDEEKQQVTEQITSTTKKDLEQCLHSLDPALYKMWQGARYTLASPENPDQQRQVMISLRTLLDKLIEKLAPDDKVRTWSTDLKYYRKQNQKKPSGTGCISYICRHLLVGSFVTFIEADISVIVKMWQYLNRVHELETSISDRQLHALVERFESALLFLIRTSQAEE